MDLETFYRKQLVVGGARTWIDMFLGRLFTQNEQIQTNCWTDEMQLVVSGPGGRLFFKMIKQMSNQTKYKIFIPRGPDCEWELNAQVIIIRDPRAIDPRVWSSLVSQEDMAFARKYHTPIITKFSSSGIMILDDIKQLQNSEFKNNPYTREKMFHIELPRELNSDFVSVPQDYIEKCRQVFLASLNLQRPNFFVFNDWNIENYHKRIAFVQKNATKLSNYLAFYIPLFGENRQQVIRQVHPFFNEITPLISLTISYL